MTTANGTKFDSWTSRDHTPAGDVGIPHSDTILAPAFSQVPDGGATAALLGLGLLGLFGLRRR
jgi:hypothetical protein